ncbi:DUF309 domain-containing protein [Haloparvum sp. PAK95]|uniref:DUF309 domain-containing protein n=1 Tax=Haloparvum sp. PAK95 TaxID=3418962 RepID=UPI003D2F1BD6
MVPDEEANGGDDPSPDARAVDDAAAADDAHAATDAPTVDDALRAGIVLYERGYYHAAHDPWEAAWLPRDGADANLLQGLIQLTAAVHHARDHNWSGATGVATSGYEYLAAVPDDHAPVDLGPARRYLARLAVDPEHAERRDPPPLPYEGGAVGVDGLGFDALALAVGAVAEETNLDESVVADAIRYAREEQGSGQARFRGLLADLVAEDPERRAVAYARLESHVERERSKERDVDGLF